jgi:hypothetical protein
MRRLGFVAALVLLLLAACGGPSLPTELVGQWRIQSFKSVGYIAGTDSTLLQRVQGRMVRSLAADGSFWWALPNLADTTQVDTLRGSWSVVQHELVLATDRSPLPRRFSITEADGVELTLTDTEDGRTETWRRVE